MLIKSMRVPAFITDSYCDLIVTNKLAITFLNIQPFLVDEAKDKNIVDGRNILRALFHADSNYRNLVGDKFIDHALLNIRFFRRTSLRYRGNQYFENLKTALMKHQLFRKYWKMTLGEVHDENTTFALYGLKTPENLNLKYLGSEIMIKATPHTELFMNMYLPLDNDTDGFFRELYEAIGPSCENFYQYTPEEKWEQIIQPRAKRNSKVESKPKPSTKKPTRKK